MTTTSTLDAVAGESAATSAPRTTTPSTRTRAWALVTGGVISAAGHLLHPVDHAETSRAVSRFELVHVLFIAGAFLVVAGLPVLRQRLGGDRLAATFVGIASGGTMMIPALVSVELFASPNVDQETFERISASADGAGALAMLALVICFAGVGMLAWCRSLSRFAAAVLVASAMLLPVMPALPGSESYWLIASLASMNLALAALGHAARDRAARRQLARRGRGSASISRSSSSSVL